MTPDHKTLTRVIIFAASMHGGQLDKIGNPYILHLMAVAADPSLKTVDEWIVAVLHDGVEETLTTVGNIEDCFGSEIAAAVEAISHRPNEPREEYIGRVLQNKTATAVKLADLRHNRSESRMGRLDEATQSRLRAKYKRDLDQIESYIADPSKFRHGRPVISIEDMKDMPCPWEPWPED